MTLVNLPAFDTAKSPPVPPGPADSWAAFGQGRTSLVDYALCLDVPAEVEAHKIKSTPSPWARPLLFERALYSSQHPAHRQVVSEWRGLVACTGLAPYLELEVEISPLQMTEADPFLKDMLSMLPPSARDGWKRIAMIRVGPERSLLGATSPATMVFTSIRGMSAATQQGIPFAVNQRLSDPTAYYREQSMLQPLQVMLVWLRDVRKRLIDRGSELQSALGEAIDLGIAGRASRFEFLLQLYNSWIDDTEVAVKTFGTTAPDLKVETDGSVIAAVLGNSLALSALYESLRPVNKASLPPQERQFFQLRGSTTVIHPNNATIHENQRPSNREFRIGPRKYVMASGKVTIPRSPTALDVSEFFESKIIELVGEMPAGSDTSFSVTVAQGRLQFFLPFKTELMSHLSQAILASAQLSGDLSEGLTVTLTVQLSDTSMTAIFSRTYPPEAIVLEYETPDLVVWPNFKSPTWTKYYYATSLLKRRAGARLTLKSADQECVESAALVERGIEWGELRKPPIAWRAFDPSDPEIGGLLFTKDVYEDKPPVLGATWDVAIDFGSTNTRVFRKSNTDDAIDEVVLADRARMLVGTNRATLPYFFFDESSGTPTEQGVPTLLWLPAQAAVERKTGWLPSDGLIFRAHVIDDTRGRVIDNLKWRREESSAQEAFIAFTRNLMVAVDAEAAASGSRVATIRTAYPSVLPPWLRTTHELVWGDVATAWGAVHRKARSEADALASYLGSQAKPNANLFAVDVGGSTADIAVWIKNTSVYRDSLHIAGSIFNRLLAGDPALKNAALAAVQDITGFAWSGTPGRDRILAGLLLRKISLKGRKAVAEYGANLYAGGPSSPGATIVAGAAYLYAVIAFQLGMIAAKEDPRIDVHYMYFGGRGSVLLEWVNAMGDRAGVTVVRHFFMAGRRFGIANSNDGGRPFVSENEVDVGLYSPQPGLKEEVARGLLMGEDVELPAARRGAVPDGIIFAKPETATEEHVTIVGETWLTAHGEHIPWDAPWDASVLASITEPDRMVPVSEMGALNAFIDAFFQRDFRLGERIARPLGIDRGKAKSAMMRDAVSEALFGKQSAFFKANRLNRIDDVVAEPVFVTEAKVLLEESLGRPLFRES